MAKEWYLSRPVEYSSEGLGHARVSDWSDTLDVVLAAGIRDNVIVYNSDLSEGEEVTGIMVNKAANTYLQTHQRQMLCHPGTITAGKYVYDGTNYWLTTGLVDDVYGVYEKIVCLLCEYKMRWQNDKGDIIERWCVATSASKYNNGQDVGTYYTTTTNNFTLILPEDKEIDDIYDKRVFLATYDFNRKVYKIARDDDILYQYGIKGSVCSFIAGKDEFNKETDNLELGICDYFVPENITGDNAYVISGDDTIFVTWVNEYSYKYYEHGEPTERNLQFEVVHDDNVDVEWEYAHNDNATILLKAKDIKDIGSIITINLKDGDDIVDTKIVKIVSFV